MLGGFRVALDAWAKADFSSARAVSYEDSRHLYSRKLRLPRDGKYDFQDG